MNIITNNEVTDIWESMPGGPAGWLKEFGYTQFAAAIEAKVIAKLAAKGDITSLEGLTRYGEEEFCATAFPDFGPKKDGDYFKVEDVRRLFATTAASAVPAEPIAYTSSIKINHIMSKTQFDNCLPKNRVAFDIPLYAAAPSTALSEKAEPGDFAKIMRCSNGQQVLFYKEVEEEGNALHCIVNYEDFQCDMKLGGIPDEAFAAALGKIDKKMADQVIQQVVDLGLIPATTKDQAASKGGDDE